jgi:Protein of unknown function (DUF2917)
MNTSHSPHYPLATQDWSLAKGRALTLQACQVRAIESLGGNLWVTVSGSQQDLFVGDGESVRIPCSHGQVVVEPLTATTTVRVALVAQSPLIASANGVTFWRAAAVSLLHPVAVALRMIADWVDPKFSRA